MFEYNGEIPFSFSLPFQVRDAVTEYSVCFNTEYNVPVEIHSRTFIRLYKFK